MSSSSKLYKIKYNNIRPGSKNYHIEFDTRASTSGLISRVISYPFASVISSIQKDDIGNIQWFTDNAGWTWNKAYDAEEITDPKTRQKRIIIKPWPLLYIKDITYDITEIDPIVLIEMNHLTQAPPAMKIKGDIAAVEDLNPPNFGDNPPVMIPHIDGTEYPFRSFFRVQFTPLISSVGHEYKNISVESVGGGWSGNILSNKVLFTSSYINNSLNALYSYEIKLSQSVIYSGIAWDPINEGYWYIDSNNKRLILNTDGQRITMIDLFTERYVLDDNLNISIDGDNKHILYLNDLTNQIDQSHELSGLCYLNEKLYFIDNYYEKQIFIKSSIYEIDIMSYDPDYYKKEIYSTNEEMKGLTVDNLGNIWYTTKNSQGSFVKKLKPRYNYYMIDYDYPTGQNQQLLFRENYKTITVEDTGGK